MLGETAIETAVDVGRKGAFDRAVACTLDAESAQRGVVGRHYVFHVSFVFESSFYFQRAYAGGNQCIEVVETVEVA